MHDTCYKNIAYLAVEYQHGVECVNEPGGEAYQACMCDKTAAQCFAEYEHEYNPYWKNRCE